MKQCPFCKANIEDGARYCLHCMTSLDTKQRWKAPRKFRTRWQREIAAFMVLAVVLGAVWWVRPDQPSIPTAPTTQNTVGASGSSSHTPAGDSLTTPTLQADRSATESGHSTTNGTSQTNPFSTEATLSPLLPQPLVTGGIPTLTLPPTVTTTAPTTPKTTTGTTTTTTTAPKTTTATTTTTTTATKTAATTTTTTSTQGTRVPLEVKSTHPQPGTRFYVRDSKHINYFPYGEETKDLYVEIVGVNIYIAEHPYLVGREATYMDIVIRTPPSEYETRLHSRINFELYDENDELVADCGLNFGVTQPNSFQTITWEIDAAIYSYTFIPTPEWSFVEFVPVGGQDAFGNLI